MNVGGRLDISLLRMELFNQEPQPFPNDPFNLICQALEQASQAVCGEGAVFKFSICQGPTCGSTVHG